jgi:hypothetical protein
MTEAIETTTSKSKSKAASPAAFDMPKFELPNFEIPKMEIPAAFREIAEKSVSQAKETYEGGAREYQRRIRLRKSAHDGEVALGDGRAFHGALAQAIRGTDGSVQGAGLDRAESRRRVRGARQGELRQGVQEGRLTIAPAVGRLQRKEARARRLGFFLIASDELYAPAPSSPRRRGPIFQAGDNGFPRARG